MQLLNLTTITFLSVNEVIQFQEMFESKMWCFRTVLDMDCLLLSADLIGHYT